MDGYATFTLKSGESLEIKDFPIGTVFTVTEEEAGQSGYTTTVEGTGKVQVENNIQTGMTGTIDAEGNNLVTFTNHKPGGGGPGPGPTTGCGWGPRSGGCRLACRPQGASGWGPV